MFIFQFWHIPVPAKIYLLVDSSWYKGHEILFVRQMTILRSYHTFSEELSWLYCSFFANNYLSCHKNPVFNKYLQGISIPLHKFLCIEPDFKKSQTACFFSASSGSAKRSFIECAWHAAQKCEFLHHGAAP